MKARSEGQHVSGCGGVYDDAIFNTEGRDERGGTEGERILWWNRHPCQTIDCAAAEVRAIEPTITAASVVAEERLRQKELSLRS